MIKGNGAERTILLVEDFDDTRLMMKMMLETQGYRVVEAVDGREAVEFARHECPDLILMDVSLPVLDGLSATRLIRKIEEICDVPIVAVTAHCRDGIHAEALDAGCNEFMPKPIDFNKLDNILGRFLA